MYALVTATKKEMLAALGPCRQRPPLVKGQFCSWLVYGRKILLMTTGIGPVNASLAIGRLVATGQRLRGVINLGIAGSFDLKKLPLLCKVTVDEETWPEFGLRDWQGVDPKGLNCPLGKVSEGPVWNMLKLRPEENCSRMGLALPPYPQVRSLTVAGATGSQSLAEHFRKNYQSEVENMEGFALAWACRQQDLPFLQVRSISNLVGSRQVEHWDMEGAMKVLAEIFKTIYANELVD